MVDNASPNGESRRRGPVRWALLVAAYLVYVYFATFFLVMDPSVMAYDQDGTETNYSSCHIGPTVRVKGPFSIYATGLCWANAVFAPIDWTRHQVLPSADPMELYPSGRAHVVANAVFFVVLLIPVWMPLLVFTEGRLVRRLRPLFAALVLVACCAGSSYLPDEPYEIMRIIGPAAGGIGLIATFVALALSARGWRQVVNIPHWIALVGLCAGSSRMCGTDYDAGDAGSND